MKNIIKIIVVGFLATITITCTSSKSTTSSGSENELEIAWNKYYATIDLVKQDFIKSKIYQLDEIHETGAYELLTMLISANMGFILCNPEYSYFRHMESPSIRIGIDNPDNFYRTASVWNPDGKHVYLVRGNRGTTADFLMETFYGPDPNGAVAVLEDEEMILDENGDFLVYLSAEREEHMKNWMKLEQDNRILSLIVRSNYAEWEKEKHGDVYIELIGKTGVKSEGTSIPGLISRINHVQKVMERQGKFWPDFAWKMTLLKKNNLQKFKYTGAIGILSQKSSYGYWELEDDEALIVKLTEVDAGYCGFQTLNFWGSSPDWRNKFTSLSWGRNGKSQAFKSADGFYYVVISKHDPGIQNWIETSGMKKGVMTLRVQSLKNLSFDFKPVTEVVKLANLKIKLPNDIPFFSPDQRKKQLELRQQHALDRYTYW